MAIEIGQFPGSKIYAAGTEETWKGDTWAHKRQGHEQREYADPGAGAEPPRRHPATRAQSPHRWTEAEQVTMFAGTVSRPVGQLPKPWDADTKHLLRSLPRGHVIVPLVAQVISRDGYLYNIEYIVMPANRVGWD